MSAVLSHPPDKTKLPIHLAYTRLPLPPPLSLMMKGPFHRALQLSKHFHTFKSEAGQAGLMPQGHGNTRGHPSPAQPIPRVLLSCIPVEPILDVDRSQFSKALSQYSISPDHCNSPGRLVGWEGASHFQDKGNGSSEHILTFLGL